MGSLGFPELIVIFILALVLFGPKKIPELGRTLGKALAEFRRASADMRLAMENELRELERHSQEVEAKGRELVEESTAPPEAVPDAPIGFGNIAPEHVGPPPAPPATLESAEVQPGGKPADGEPKSA